ncbi:MAG: hypothetical protein FWF54_10350 [Candidatus Azobacteroides sp.]|nr:hypothetical protein [Candidatus Azobacteroides sp.]
MVPLSSLEKAGKDIGDRRDRISELKSSKSDISDMRKNESVEFRYANASDKNNPAGKSNPVTAPDGTNAAGHNVIAIYTEGNAGSKIHESRHGGQIARGEYSFDKKGNPSDGYNVNSEISAYRAQYAYNGNLNYREAYYQEITPR